MAGEQWSFQGCVLRHPTISPPTCSSRTGQATPSTAGKPHKQEIIDMQVMCGTFSEHESLLLDPISIMPGGAAVDNGELNTILQRAGTPTIRSLVMDAITADFKNFLKRSKGCLNSIVELPLQHRANAKARDSSDRPYSTSTSVRSHYQNL